MATYVTSDIHGCYSQFSELLSVIDLRKEDVLYVIGDVIDRGPDSYKVLMEIRGRKNVILLLGNHEQMLVDFVKYGDRTWKYNGSSATVSSFGREFGSDVNRVLYGYVPYFSTLPLYKSLTVNGKKFLLVHAGVDYDTPLGLQVPNDLIWMREPFLSRDERFEDYDYVVHGHTPNTIRYGIKGIKYGTYKISLDGGVFCGGTLNCLRLDDMKEYVIGL